ncbi:hypothetical protein F4775DRAFT_358198 [Biscogniauxia sp. FL1348]|nr:hypothetical protein F4775DRAFT_358198 [Biscogniauxia sp. FL1348]
MVLSRFLFVLLYFIFSFWVVLFLFFSFLPSSLPSPEKRSGGGGCGSGGGDGDGDGGFSFANQKFTKAPTTRRFNWRALWKGLANQAPQFAIGSDNPNRRPCPGLLTYMPGVPRRVPTKCRGPSPGPLKFMQFKPWNFPSLSNGHILHAPDALRPPRDLLRVY